MPDSVGAEFQAMFKICVALRDNTKALPKIYVPDVFDLPPIISPRRGGQRETAAPGNGGGGSDDSSTASATEWRGWYPSISAPGA
jgi:hypothetical protein